MKRQSDSERGENGEYKLEVYTKQSEGKNSHHVDVLLTADAPLSRVAQFARHEAAAE